MKKFSIMLMTALALGFTACEDYEPAQPQSNPQEPIMSAEGIVVAPVDTVATPSFDLKALADAEQQAAVLNVVEAQNLPAVGDLTFVMQLSKSDDFASVQEVATSIVNNQVCVAPADWQAAYLKVIGKNPKTQDAYVRFAAYVVNGTSSVRIGNPNLYYGAHKVSVTPYPSAVTIEEAYSLVINGGETIAFNHSGDQYDNPVFSIKVDFAEAAEWAVKGAELTYAPVAGEEETAGTLVAGEGWGEMPVGPWVLSVNMETLTYSFAPAFDNLWTPGDANGWNHGGSQMLSTTDYANYYGFANLSPSGFKFTSAADWDHINYGAGGEDGKLSTDGGAGNLSVAEKGLYWCDVNIAALTWKATKIDAIGVIGDFNGWSESVALEPVDDTNLQWTGTVTFTGEGGYKFRCNDAWEIDLGGNPNVSEEDQQWYLISKGANLKSPEAGTYTVTLDLSIIPYACDLVKLAE